MKRMSKKYYHEDNKNRYCYFQPATSISPKEIFAATKQMDSLPNPLNRYRIPTPRLVPRGY
jgi:hypothetical protein